MGQWEHETGQRANKSLTCPRLCGNHLGTEVWTFSQERSHSTTVFLISPHTPFHCADHVSVFYRYCGAQNLQSTSEIIKDVCIQQQHSYVFPRLKCFWPSFVRCTCLDMLQTIHLITRLISPTASKQVSSGVFIKFLGNNLFILFILLYIFFILFYCDFEFEGCSIILHAILTLKESEQLKQAFCGSHDHWRKAKCENKIKASFPTLCAIWVFVFLFSCSLSPRRLKERTSQDTLLEYNFFFLLFMMYDLCGAL